MKHLENFRLLKFVCFVLAWPHHTSEGANSGKSFLAFFAFFVFVGGQLIGKLGARNLGILGGVILGAGWMLASQSSSIMMLAVCYGAIGETTGLGIHFAVADLRGTGRLDIVAPGISEALITRHILDHFNAIRSN